MASFSTSSLQHSSRKEWFLLHVSFILIGVISTLLGPILPAFSRHWLLSDAQAGFFFTAQYFGSAVGVALTSLFLPRFGFSRVTAAGFGAFLIGFLFLGLGPWMLSALLIGIIGFGYGLTSPAINLRGTQLPSKSTAAAVTLLNFSWSVGAVLCPFLVGWLFPWMGLRNFSKMLAGCSAVLMALHLSLRGAPSARSQTRYTHSWEEWIAHLRLPQTIPLVLLFFFYVGTEVALGGWVASYEKRMPGMSGLALVVAPSFFYGALLLGRGVAPLALRRVAQIRVSICGLLLATAGCIVIAISDSPRALYLGAAIAGFGLAPQYPILVTWLAAIFQTDSSWIGALFFSAGGIGGGALPWLVGIVSNSMHSLRVGLCIPLAVSFGMIFLVRRARPAAQLGNGELAVDGNR